MKQPLAKRDFTLLLVPEDSLCKGNFQYHDEGHSEGPPVGKDERRKDSVLTVVCVTGKYLPSPSTSEVLK